MSLVECFRLLCTTRSPSDEIEDKYLAEMPVIPGCQTRGGTWAEALDHVHSVVAEARSIESIPSCR